MPNTVDSKKEFRGELFIALYQKYSIELEVTTSYLLLQNSIIKYSNQTITKQIRAMIIDSKVPKNLQPKILNSIIYIINHTTILVVDSITLYKAFYSQLEKGKLYKLLVAYLRVLGYKVFIYISKERRIKSAKFDNRAKEGILFRFEGNYIYRVQIPLRSYKLVRSSNI